MRSNEQATKPAFDLLVHGHGVDKYPAKAHARRVAEAHGSDSGVIVLEGERKVNYSNSDQPRHFRQDRYFYYITGCNEPDCYVTYNIAEDCLTLWLPHANPSRIFYDGRGSTPKEALEKYDIDDAKYIRTGSQRDAAVSALVGIMRTGAFNEERLLVMPSTVPYLSSCETALGTELNIAAAETLMRAFDTCRAIKDATEVALIRKANEISSKAHLEVLKVLRSLRKEAEAEGLFLNTCISNNAKEQAYGPIVGSGPNAGILHYQANNEDFDDRQVLLIDASCEWQLYAADITRTMPLNHKNPGYWPSKESEAIYKAVEKVQEACIRLLKPGRRSIDVNWSAVHMTIDALLELGLLKGDHMEIFHTGTVSAFFPHGLGHHIGLEVHDVAPPPPENHLLACSTPSVRRAYAAHTKDMSPRHNALPGFSEAEHFSLNPSTSLSPCTVDSPPLEPGNVVTIEPGIYFNKFILDTVFLADPKHRRHIDEEVLKRYMPVGGVRIEDDILITEKGFENLTGALKGEEMLEAIRKGK
ncbi:hypothetical protein Q7P37_010717 [Cladosporium fusiforme]